MATNAEQIVTQAPAVEIDEEVVAQQYVDKILAEEAATTRPRDETGKFVSPDKESETAPVKAEADEDAAPVEAQPSGDDGEEIEPGDSPPIEAPAFWSAEQKQVWDSLTPEAKNVVLARETERDAAVRRAQNETAETRKAIEARETTVKQMEQQYADSLKIVTQAILTADSALAEWSNITDHAKAYEEDPVRYGSLQIRAQQAMVRLSNVQAEQNRIAEHRQNEAKQAHSKRLAEVFPDFADPVKGKAIVDKWAPLLLQNGFTQEEVGQTRDVLWDPRHLKVFDMLFDKASKFDKAEAARKTIVEKKVAQQAPKVAKPKAQDDGQKGKSPRVAALEQRAKESGSLQDKADYFSALLAEE